MANKEELKYHISTLITSNNKIKQEIYLIKDKFLDKLAEYIIDTQEQGINDALIKLGWTPPKRDK